MDPAMQPINGITLERYADLGAAVADHMNDPKKVSEIIAAEGVQAADWEAAKTGWTARMQDMSLMGRVAMAYMPLYQAALAKRKGGQATCSYEDYVAASAAIKVWGFEVALNAMGVSQSDWTEVAAEWNNTMGSEMMRYAGHHGLVSQEEARLRAGGQPRRPTITRNQGQAPSPAAMPANVNPVAAAMQNPVMQQQHAANAAIMANPIGFGFGQAVAAVTGGVAPGARVFVTWSDGNQYPGRVMQTSPQQTLVQFDNGSQQWVPAHAVRPA
jgi:hypothetical protein